MSEPSGTPILHEGGPPPQRHLWDRAFVDEENLLLVAAWAHGLEAEDVVHRYTLFAFIQTHLQRKSEEQLQRKLENSLCWEGQGKGDYVLQGRGSRRILRLYGANPERSTLNACYVFRSEFEEHELVVQLQPATHAIVISIDGIPVKGVEACRRLESLGATFRTMSSPATSRVWNWIVQTTDFTWHRRGGWGEVPRSHRA